MRTFILGSWGKEMHIKRLALAVLCALSCSITCVNAEEKASSSGTGFFVNAEGWLATNAHVIEGCESITVGTFGSVLQKQVDTQNDLAIVRVSTPASGISGIAIRRASPRLGEDVAALGYPLSGLLSDSVKITTGNINSLVGIENDTRYLQISTPIQPGNSGGPLLDKAGSLLGINTATLGSKFAANSGILPQNVNFAVRASVLELFLQARGVKYQSVDTAETPLATADLADKVSPSVIQILCYGQKNEEAPVASAHTNPPSSSTVAPIPEPFLPHRSFIVVGGLDVIGFDYATLKNVTFGQCKSACADDLSCKAVTYNRDANYCFLKNDAALLIRNKDAIASYSTEKAGDVLKTSISIHASRDSAGGDYRRLQGSTFVGCFVACIRDDVCRAFSYVRKSNDCWLKSQVGVVTKRAGVELGIK
ncbi:trypsin-like peptidase domain-containing protein [Phyllobacterium endophyticum]